MKNTIKKSLAAIFAAAMCAVPMVSAMSASAGNLEGIKREAIEINFDAKEYKKASELTFAKGGIKKAEELPIYRGEYVRGQMSHKFEIGRVIGPSGHWEWVYVNGCWVLVWVKDDWIDPRAEVTLGDGFRKGIDEFIRNKAVTAVIAEKIEKISIAGSRRTDRVTVIDMATKQERLVTKANAQNLLVRTANIDASSAKRLLSR
jgi:hypothetical protein